MYTNLVIIVLVLVVFAFEIAMLVDVIRNDRIASNAKAWWVIGMLLIHPFVAIIYYFTDRNKA
jgi:uncharacterized membrane protein